MYYQSTETDGGSNFPVNTNLQYKNFDTSAAC